MIGLIVFVRFPLFEEDKGRDYEKTFCAESALVLRRYWNQLLVFRVFAGRIDIGLKQCRETSNEPRVLLD